MECGHVSKICNFCKIEQPLVNYHKGDGKFGLKGKCKKCCSDYEKANKHRYAGYYKKYYSENKEKHRERSKAYNIKNAEKTKEYSKWLSVKRNYGITKEQYFEMFDKQNGVCDICKKPENKKTVNGNLKMLNIDHCHTTGKVRGLLCQTCNHGLGMYYDTIDYLESAIVYLRKSNG